MGVIAAKQFMNQAPFHSTFPILVITKIFDSLYDRNPFFSYLGCLSFEVSCGVEAEL